MEKDLVCIKEFFTLHNIEVEKEKTNDEIMVHYQVYANKELDNFQVNASLVYQIRKFADKSLADEFHSFKTPAYNSEYLASMKLLIDHKKESINLSVVISKESNEKISSLKSLDVEAVVFNELVKLAKQYAKETYTISSQEDKALETVESINALKERAISKCEILSVSEMLDRLKEISSKNYELKKENLILEEANANQKSMLKGLYNEKMAIYKSIIFTVLLLGISIFLIV